MLRKLQQRRVFETSRPAPLNTLATGIHIHDQATGSIGPGGADVGSGDPSRAFGEDQGSIARLSISLG
jgi:hypothetical protein